MKKVPLFHLNRSMFVDLLITPRSRGSISLFHHTTYIFDPVKGVKSHVKKLLLCPLLLVGRRWNVSPFVRAFRGEIRRQQQDLSWHVPSLRFRAPSPGAWSTPPSWSAWPSGPCWDGNRKPSVHTQKVTESVRRDMHRNALLCFRGHVKDKVSWFFYVWRQIGMKIKYLRVV